MFNLIELPYKQDALAPYMSSETFEFHHGKHLAAYVAFVNDFVSKEPALANKSIEEIVVLSAAKPEWQGLFNNAAQVYNHNEFFSLLKKSEKPSLPDVLSKQINKDFGSFDVFKEQFVTAGKTQFGSGWVWLVVNNGKLEIKKYSNAGNPLPEKLPSILACDVWEHTYYIDYRNRRPDFLNAFVDHLINWDLVSAKFSAIK